MTSMIEHVAEGRLPTVERNPAMRGNDEGVFQVRGRYFPYLRTMYNNTTYNERSVEVPVALHLLSKMKVSRVLEVGAVLPHYLPDWIEPFPGKTKKQIFFPHVCIDLMEKYPGVTRTNIFTWLPHRNEKYDLIISISTMDHIMDQDFVGLSDSDKVKKFRNLMNTMGDWMTPEGLRMITLPAGQPLQIGGGGWIDMYLAECKQERLNPVAGGESNPVYPDYIFKMNRMGFGTAGNKWHEVDIHAAPDLPYFTQIPSAGTVYFLFWGNLKRFWL